MADKSSKFYLVSEISSGGKTYKYVSGWSINPSITDADAVSVGNAFAPLAQYEVTGFRRVDTNEFAIDEFE